MRGLLFALAVLLLPLCARAQSFVPSLIGQSVAASPPPGPCPYAVDNGCAGNTTYVAVPAFQSTSFAFNSAQTGQLPTSPTALQIATYNTLLHCIAWTGSTCNSLQNEPWIDYPIGSAAPASLAPISSFPGDSVCNAVSTASLGTVPTNAPYVRCRGTATGAGIAESIGGYDFTNGGTASVLLILGQATSGAGVTYTLTNDYFKLGSFSGYQGNGLAYTTWVSGGWNIELPTGAGPPPANVVIRNITCDGDFADAPSAAAGQAYCILDNRQGPTTPWQWPGSMTYSLIDNHGHNPIQGANGGSWTFTNNAFIDNCQSGQSFCHGEVMEETAVGTTRTLSYTGNVFRVSAQKTVNGTTTPFYLTAGNAGNTIVTATVKNNLTVVNATACVNAAPYSPNNPCSGGTLNGSALFSTDYDTSAVLDIEANIIDGSGSFYCAVNENNVYPNSFAATATTNIFTVTHPDNSYNAVNTFVLWAGQTLVDNTNGGWVPTTMTSYGTYSNSGTINNAACVVGVNPGCGTINLGASEPSTSPTDTYVTYATTTITDGANNYSIGGAFGVGARKVTWSQANPWASAGFTSCP